MEEILKSAVGRRQLLIGAATVGTLGLVACGPGGASEDELTRLRSENERLKTKNDKLEEENNRLVTEAGTGEEGVEPTSAGAAAAAANIRPNVASTFNPDIEMPTIGEGTYIDPAATVIGNVTLGKEVYVGPNSSIRGDEGQPLWVGDGTNLQDGVTLHALETVEDGEVIEKNLVTVDGKKYAIYVGNNVSVAHMTLIHGPAAVMDNTFVGMMAFVFKAVVGKNVVIEPRALVMGVTIPDGRYVPAGDVIKTQAQADALPVITEDYAFRTINDGVLHVNHQLAEGYGEES